MPEGLFPELARDAEVPAWRGTEHCVWSWCPGRFEVAEPEDAHGCTLLRCTACGHEHLEGPAA